MNNHEDITPMERPSIYRKCTFLNTNLSLFLIPAKQPHQPSRPATPTWYRLTIGLQACVGNRQRLPMFVLTQITTWRVRLLLRLASPYHSQQRLLSETSAQRTRTRQQQHPAASYQKAYTPYWGIARMIRSGWRQTGYLVISTHNSLVK